MFNSPSSQGPVRLKIPAVPWSASPGAWLRTRFVPRRHQLESSRLILGTTLHGNIIALNDADRRQHCTILCENPQLSQSYLEGLILQHVLSGGGCLYLDYSELPSTLMQSACSRLHTRYRAMDSSPAANQPSHLFYAAGKTLWHIRGLSPAAWGSERHEKSWLDFMLQVLERVTQDTAEKPLLVAASAATTTNEKAFRNLLAGPDYSFMLLRARKPGHEYSDGSSLNVFLGELRDLLQLWPTRVFPQKDPHLGAWVAGSKDRTLVAMSPAHIEL